MNQLSKLRIGHRLGVAFAAVIVMAAVVVTVGITRLAESTRGLANIGTDIVPRVQRLTEVTDDVNLIAREMRNALIYRDESQVNAALEATVQARDRTAKALGDIGPSLTSAEGRKRLAAVAQARALYMPVHQEMIDQIREGKAAEASVMLAGQLQPAQMAYLKAVTQLRNHQVEAVDEAVNAGQSSYQRARAVLVALLASMVVVGAVLGWMITRSITRPIDLAVRVAERVAAGDLGSVIHADGRDETSRLLQALKTMNDGLASIVQTVRCASDSIATGSSEIASGNADLSHRTEQQASALEVTAASMEELGTTVRQNADHARQANELALNASSVAQRGGQVVSQVVATMKGINDSSRRIADITGVIDSIAFQTNILALNAAVEAARAGEQGRGFAVVAAEVRTLAQRSAEAAKEIKALIGASVDRVAQGSTLVDEAGHTMDEVVGSIRRVTEIMADISHASSEQSAGVTQVGQAVSQMDQTTQQNAALVEQSAAAAESLKHQARALVGAVAVFKLADDQAALRVSGPVVAPGGHADQGDAVDRAGVLTAV